MGEANLEDFDLRGQGREFGEQSRGPAHGRRDRPPIDIVDGRVDRFGTGKAANLGGLARPASQDIEPAQRSRPTHGGRIDGNAEFLDVATG